MVRIHLCEIPRLCLPLVGKPVLQLITLRDPLCSWHSLIPKAGPADENSPRAVPQPDRSGGSLEADAGADLAAIPDSTLPRSSAVSAGKHATHPAPAAVVRAERPVNRGRAVRHGVDAPIDGTHSLEGTLDDATILTSTGTLSFMDWAQKCCTGSMPCCSSRA